MLYSTFYVEDTHFGLPIMSILEIGRSFKVHHVHGAPNPVQGLINLRGKIITVLDLGLALGMGPIQKSDDSRFFILKSNKELSEELLSIDFHTSPDNIAIHAERMGDVMEIDSEKIAPVPANSSHPYYRNVIKQDDHFIVILDLEKLLNLTAYQEEAENE